VAANIGLSGKSMQLMKYCTFAMDSPDVGIVNYYKKAISRPREELSPAYPSRARTFSTNTNNFLKALPPGNIVPSTWNDDYKANISTINTNIDKNAYIPDKFKAELKSSVKDCAGGFMDFHKSIDKLDDKNYPGKPLAHQKLYSANEMGTVVDFNERGISCRIPWQDDCANDSTTLWTGSCPGNKIVCNKTDATCYTPEDRDDKLTFGDVTEKISQLGGGGICDLRQCKNGTAYCGPIRAWDEAKKHVWRAWRGATE
tara:strand:- start:3275 stop:4045 length:771 start_codon:yes stop_codon:yes gene_type:complete